MKFLEITEEVEKALVQIFDHAYKNAGFALHSVVNLVMSKVKADQPVSPADQSTPKEDK